MRNQGSPASAGPPDRLSVGTPAAASVSRTSVVSGQYGEATAASPFVSNPTSSGSTGSPPASTAWLNASLSPRKAGCPCVFGDSTEPSWKKATFTGTGSTVGVGEGSIALPPVHAAATAVVAARTASARARSVTGYRGRRGAQIAPRAPGSLWSPRR